MFNAYHGDESLKARFLEQLALHQKEDRLRQGDYGNLRAVYPVAGSVLRWKGCAVACSIRSLFLARGLELTVDELDNISNGYRSHSLLADKLGIPRELALLEDIIFEGFDIDDEAHLEWPMRFASAMRVGADLGKVWPTLALKLAKEAGYPAFTAAMELRLQGERGDIYADCNPETYGRIPHSLRPLLVAVDRWHRDDLDPLLSYYYDGDDAFEGNKMLADELIVAIKAC